MAGDGDEATLYRFRLFASNMTIKEVRRFPAPGPEPLGLAYDAATLWISSREGHRLFAVDPQSWTVRREFPTPGAPFGIAIDGDALRVIVGFGDDDDDRYLYRFDPRSGFDSERFACPDLSGVHVAVDGDATYVSQAHNHRIVSLDPRGSMVREVPLSRRPVGMSIIDGVLHLVTADLDWKHHELTTLDARGKSFEMRTLASIPFGARGLAFDGAHFWTSDRRANEIVNFAIGAY